MRMKLLCWTCVRRQKGEKAARNAEEESRVSGAAGLAWHAGCGGIVVGQERYMCNSRSWGCGKVARLAACVQSWRILVTAMWDDAVASSEPVAGRERKGGQVLMVSLLLVGGW
jgi:hypothetical protein